MQAHKLPAQQGWTWIIQSFRLWRENPLILTTSATTFIIIVMLPAMLIPVPVVGQLIAIFAAPPLTVGMYLICRALDQGQPVQQSLLFQGFRHNMRNQIQLSAILLIMASISDAIITFINDGTLAPALSAPAPDAQQVAGTQLSSRAWLAIGFSLLFYCFMTMVNYFAPQLVGLKKLSPIKGLVFSLLAYWRNLGAFFIFFIGLIFIALCIAAVSKLFNATIPALGSILLVLFVMLLAPCSMAASYLAVRDIFGDLLEESDDA